MSAAHGCYTFCCCLLLPGLAHAKSKLIMPGVRCDSWHIRRHLSSGRAADDHHLYPPPGALPAGALQAPVDPAREYTCTGLDIDLRVHAGSAATVAPHVASAGLGAGFGAHEPGSWPGSGVDPWAAAAAAAADGGADGGRLVACLGDQQVAFMKALVALSQAPPAHLRMPGKRGTFFARLDPRRPATLGLPKLLRQCAPDRVPCSQLETLAHPVVTLGHMMHRQNKQGPRVTS